MYALLGISARMVSSHSALGVGMSNSHTLVKLVVKLAQQDMNAQANFYPQFFARRVTIPYWEMENVLCALLVLLVARLYFPHSSAPQATIPDRGQHSAASAPWVSNASTQTKTPCHAPLDNTHHRDLHYALIALSGPSVRALRSPLHTHAPVGSSHQA